MKFYGACLAAYTALLTVALRPACIDAAAQNDQSAERQCGSTDEGTECRSDSGGGGGGGANDASSNNYGVDVSYPIQSHKVSANYDSLPHNVDPISHPTPVQYDGKPVQPLGNKQQSYDELLRGCRDAVSDFDDKSMCNTNERDRIAMNVRQPQSMKNYTDFGIKKIRAPERVIELLTEFWETNSGLEYPEDWSVGNMFVNTWETPSYMLSIENTDLQGGGEAIKKRVWDAAVDTISEWTGQKLTTSSIYGIRVYKEGAILAPHVDRLPLVSSAIINVAQDVDEPWPIEVYTHDGKAHNITMEPGDMVLYESHSVIHGRPFPLKGKYYANVFIHFQPVPEDPNVLPDYLIPGSPGAVLWARENKSPNKSTDAHRAAIEGDLELLKEIASGERKGDLFALDANQWQPLHEAARGGHADIAQFLLDQGAEVNAVAWYGMGSSPLYIALEEHGEDAPVVKVLEEHGGRNIVPAEGLYD